MIGEFLNRVTKNIRGVCSIHFTTIIYYATTKPYTTNNTFKTGVKGYAFIVIDYSQEHDLYFVCAMDNGEIWTYNNKEIIIQNNLTLNRKNNE